MKRGADIETRTFDGKTALMVAALVGNYEAAKLRFEKGANAEEKDKQGNDSLAYSMLNQGGNVHQAAHPRTASPPGIQCRGKRLTSPYRHLPSKWNS